jgi:hypothetical protein
VDWSGAVEVHVWPGVDVFVGFDEDVEAAEQLGRLGES